MQVRHNIHEHMHQLPITRNLRHDVVPTLLKMLRRVMHVYPDILCRDMLRKDIRHIFLTIYLPHFNFTTCHLILLSLIHI